MRQRMESLIRIRYLFDTLQPDEQVEAIKRIAVARGTQWIITLIFNHFAKRLQSNLEDQSTIAVITKEISDVIIDHKSKTHSQDIAAANDDESETEDEPISIEDIPSVMVSKIASYLTQNDYIRFMHSSRRILIGCHAPFSLCHVNIHDRNYNQRVITSALSARSLKVHYGQNATFNTAKALASKSNIETLRMIQTRGSLFCISTLTFLQFINSLPRLKCLDLPLPIFLLPIARGKLNEDQLPMMLNLKGTVCRFGDNDSCKVLRSLIGKHAKQMESLKVVLGCGWTPDGAKTPEFSLCNLTELKMVDNRSGHNFQLLSEWIKQSSKLKMCSISCSWDTALSELIPFLIETQPDLEFTEFEFNTELGTVMKFMQRIGYGLSLSKLKENGKINEDKEFKLRIRFKGGWIDRKQFKAQEATEILVKILRKHKGLTVRKLNRKFDSQQSSGSDWEGRYMKYLGDFKSFVKNHDRFRIQEGGEKKSTVAPVRDPKQYKGDGEGANGSARMPNTEQKAENIEKAQKIIDEVGHFAQILEGCNLRHFLVQIIMRPAGFMRTSKKQKAEGMEGGMDDLLMKWKEEYRVDIHYQSSDRLTDDRWRVTFCNKDNPMKGGYRAHGLFIE